MRNVERISEIRLGQKLVELGVITAEQLSEAINGAKRHETPLAYALMEMGFASEWDVARAVTLQFQTPFINVTTHDISRDVRDILPTVFLHKYQILPLDLFDNVFTVAMGGLIAPDVIREIEKISGYEVFLYVGLANDVRALLNELFSLSPAVARAGNAGSWEKLFDLGDEEVMREIGLTDGEAG